MLVGSVLKTLSVCYHLILQNAQNEIILFNSLTYISAETTTFQLFNKSNTNSGQKVPEMIMVSELFPVLEPFSLKWQLIFGFSFWYDDSFEYSVII